MIEHLEPTDFFLTIAKEFWIEIKIKGSKFLGFAFPISDKKEAEDILEKHRKKYYDATHICFAYSIGLDNEIFRYSDDGEPSGTAGKPIYQAIKHFELKNILVIVTRYFGGTKLGVGPLARAYYDAAFDVLNVAERKTEYVTKILQIKVDYTFVTVIKRLLEPVSVETKEEYLADVTFTAKILSSKEENCKNEIIELTQGKAGIILL